MPMTILSDKNVADLLRLSEEDPKTCLSIKIFIETGLKVSELMGITLKNVIQDRNVLCIYEQESESIIVNWRVITERKVSPILMKDIIEYIDKYNVKDKLIECSPTTIINHIKAYGEDLGIELTPKELRQYSNGPFSGFKDRWTAGYKSVLARADKQNRVNQPPKSPRKEDDKSVKPTKVRMHNKFTINEEKPPIRYIVEINNIVKYLAQHEKMSAWNTVYSYIPKLAEYRPDGYEALAQIYPEILNDTDKSKAWDDINNLKASFPDDSYHHIKLIRNVLNYVPANSNKDYLWDYIFDYLTHFDLKNNPAYYPEYCNLLAAVYPHIPNKTKAWHDIISLTNTRTDHAWYNTARLMNKICDYVEDKQQAWDDYFKLVQDKDKLLQCFISDVDASNFFSGLEDKEGAWNEIIKLVLSDEKRLQNSGLKMIYDVLPCTGGMHKVWADICDLMQNKKIMEDYFSLITKKDEGFFDIVRIYYLHQAPDKDRAWSDIYSQLIKTENRDNDKLIVLLDRLLPQLKDKQKAWDNLYGLIFMHGFNEKDHVIQMLDKLKLDVPDKQTAWDDIYRLRNTTYGDKDKIIKILESMIDYVPNKEKIWKELLQLLQQDNVNKQYIINILKNAYLSTTNKQEAWNDLCKLANDKDITIRDEAFKTLGYVLFYTSNRVDACEKLLVIAKERYNP